MKTIVEKRISDSVIISLVTGLFALASTVFTGLMTYKMETINTKVEDVKRTGEATHILVNSNALAQLKLTFLALKQSAVNLHRIADLTKQKGDIDAATAADLIVVEAERLYNEHQIEQNKVDAINADHTKKDK